MKKLFYVLSLLVIASMVLSACGARPPPTAAPQLRLPLKCRRLRLANRSLLRSTRAPISSTSSTCRIRSSRRRTQLGADAKKFDAKLDPNLGVSLVNDAISAGAKGIAITVPDQTIGPAIAKAAKDAGVVLIATDDSIKDADGNPVPFVGFDGKDMGKKVGEAAAKLLTDSGWLKDTAKKVGVLSVEVQTLSVCNDRTDNEKAAIKAAGVTGRPDLPGAVHGRDAVLARRGRPDHHGPPRRHELGGLRAAMTKVCWVR